MTQHSHSHSYYLVVVATFKNESLSLPLWIDHYLWQGVDHFYLIDNGSTDDSKNVLNEFIDQGIVTYRYLPERHAQVKHYRQICQEESLSTKTQWILVCDIDEFFFGVHRPLADTLRHMEQHPIIQSNWLMFGTHLDTHPPDIRVALTERQPHLHILTKYIFQPSRVHNPIQSIHVHSLLNRHHITHTENDMIHLNHYPLQSREYFEKVKMNRGDVHHPHHDSTRNWDYFESMNRDNSGHTDTLLAERVLHGYPSP